jgi:hypothetical protein
MSLLGSPDLLTCGEEERDRKQTEQRHAQLGT